MPFESRNPANDNLLERYDDIDAAALDAALDTAHHAWGRWREVPFERRAERLSAAASLLRERADDFARLMALEMGKPLEQGRSEALKCARCCDFYAENAPRFLAHEPVEAGAQRSYVRYDPLGPVLAIMPWNFPFWQVIRFSAPGLMAGNVALLKHAENVPQCALALERLFADAGFPEGCFTNLFITRDQTADVIADDRVAAVTLTGSTRAGAAVAAQAGRHIKKTVLELGGSDPFIVFADADLERAARVAAQARLLNSGQSCIAAKRFLVEASAADAFTDAFRAELEGWTLGDPLDPSTRVGPIARDDLRNTLADQVRRTLKEGARCLLGGNTLTRPGYFYPVTLLTDIPVGSPADTEELFGPVASLFTFDAEEDAISLANHTVYGLGAAVFTADLERAERLAGQLEVGCVAINDFVRSTPELPFGGVKRSGYGRELASHGIREFTNAKSIWIGPA